MFQLMANGRTGRYGEAAALRVAEEYSGVSGNVWGHFGMVRTVRETLKSPVTATPKAARVSWSSLPISDRVHCMLIMSTLLPKPPLFAC